MDNAESVMRLARGYQGPEHGVQNGRGMWQEAALAQVSAKGYLLVEAPECVPEAVGAALGHAGRVHDRALGLGRYLET